MTLKKFLDSVLRLFYHLTVGLTVMLLRAGLLYIIAFLVFAAWMLVVWAVTWKTYKATGHHLGWSAGACGLSAVLCWGLIVAVHRVVKDWLGLTNLSLAQLLALVFLKRRPPPAPAQEGEGDRGPGDAGRWAGGTEERVNVKVTRTRRVVVTGSSSSAEKRTTDIWR